MFNIRVGHTKFPLKSRVVSLTKVYTSLHILWRRILREDRFDATNFFSTQTWLDKINQNPSHEHLRSNTPSVPNLFGLERAGCSIFNKIRESSPYENIFSCYKISCYVRFSIKVFRFIVCRQVGVTTVGISSQNAMSGNTTICDLRTFYFNILFPNSTFKYKSILTV